VLRRWALCLDQADNALCAKKPTHDEPNVYTKTIAFSQGDQWLAAGLAGDNRDILLWPLATESLVKLACSRLDDPVQCL